jgi:hypothetical protein
MSESLAPLTEAILFEIFNMIGGIGHVPRCVTLLDTMSRLAYSYSYHLASVYASVYVAVLSLVAPGLSYLNTNDGMNISIYFFTTY